MLLVFWTTLLNQNMLFQEPFKKKKKGKKITQINYFVFSVIKKSKSGDKKKKILMETNSV